MSYFNYVDQTKEIEFVLNRSMTEYERGVWVGVSQALIEYVDVIHAIDNGHNALTLFGKIIGIDYFKEVQKVIDNQ